MYAYVGSNPTNFNDPEGEIGQVALGALYGGITGAVGGYITGYANTGSVKGALVGAVGGGLAGAAVGTINPFLARSAGAAFGSWLSGSAVAGFLTGTASSAAGQLTGSALTQALTMGRTAPIDPTKNFSAGAVLVGGITGAITGPIGAVVSGAIRADAGIAVGSLGTSGVMVTENAVGMNILAKTALQAASSSGQIIANLPFKGYPDYTVQPELSLGAGLQTLQKFLGLEQSTSTNNGASTGPYTDLVCISNCLSNYTTGGYSTVKSPK